jgi:two-component system response regulator PilR (NtrC family)
VDDEESIREFLQIMLQREGYEITTAENGAQALELLRKKSFDLVISDLQMPELNGIELLEKCKEMAPETIFMMITAFGTTETAVEAMKKGAYDYILKPFKIDEVRIVVAQALKSKALETENRQLKRELHKEYSFQNIVGNSASMHQIFELVKRVSQAPSNILITGESGTGKELVAKAIHYNGPLKDKPFVTINCGAIPESLMESEMFGHKKGAFTSAISDKPGLFEVANGGTLFLDEVGELPQSIQVKLLRAIQERVIRRVGANEDIKVEVRIIAATNRDLEQMVEKKLFRQDLFYRLNVIQIKTPSLRERREDIPLLVNHFIKKHAEKMGKSIMSVSDEALALLKSYDYPGNVRELENIIERTLALETGSVILPESLPPSVLTPQGRKSISVHDIEVPPTGIMLEKILNQVEKDLIVKAIHSAGGVKKKAAKLLGISFRSMRYRCEKFNLGSFDDEETEEEEVP